MRGWLKSTICEVCDTGGGEVKTGPFGSQLHQSDYQNIGIPVVMPADIINEKIDRLRIARVSQGHVDRLYKYKLSKAERFAAERKRRAAEQKAGERARKKREKALARKQFLEGLAGREDSIWKNVNDLIITKQPAKYDEAVKLLVDLRDLYKKTEREKTFKQKLITLSQAHYRKVSFMDRLQKAKLR